MDLFESEAIANSQKPFEMNVSTGDDVLIVSDTAKDQRVWACLNKAARAMDIEPTVTLIPEPAGSNHEPPAPVANAMLEADYVLLPTSKALAHSNAVKNAIDQNDTGITPMSEIELETLAGPAASVDYDYLHTVSSNLYEALSTGTTLEVDAPAGTDLTVDIENVRANYTDGKIRREIANYAPFPDGEANVFDAELTADGTVVWDSSMHDIGPIDEPIAAEIVDGTVTAIEGGREAETLTALLEEYASLDSYHTEEVAIGCNPGARFEGRLREDKKAWGYIHIAIGRSAAAATGDIEGPIHLDGILSDATVTVDGTALVEDGDITTEFAS